MVHWARQMRPTRLRRWVAIVENDVISFLPCSPEDQRPSHLSTSAGAFPLEGRRLVRQRQGLRADLSPAKRCAPAPITPRRRELRPAPAAAI